MPYLLTMLFLRKVVTVTVKKIKLKINFNRGDWKYIKLFSNLFFIDTSTKQPFIVHYKKAVDYNYTDLAKDLNYNYTEIKYNENVFYHYYKNFSKDSILQYEWILIKDCFVITFTTTISSKESNEEIERQYENVKNILRIIDNI